MDEMTLEKEAMRLSARERALLADALLESLSDEATQQIQELWAVEAVGSGNSGRPFSGKSVRFDEEINSDRLVADQRNEGKDDTYADTTRDPGTAERRPHAEGDR